MLTHVYQAGRALLFPLPLFFLFAFAACGTISPGFDDARSDATLDGRGDIGPGNSVDVTLPGRVCRTSAECDDKIDCTEDLCGSDGRCANLPNAGRCDNRTYCDGFERCDVRRGCTRGEPITCNDDDVCTQDRCVEATRSCEHRPLDRDGDGDPDQHCHARACDNLEPSGPDAGANSVCWRGHDCDDTNPRINSVGAEICGDMLDNNCNGQRDESGCIRDPHDRCDAPLDVSAGGSFRLNLGGATQDYALPCANSTMHDIVARFHLDAPRDVMFRADSTNVPVALALQTQCGSADPGGTIACGQGAPAQLRRHSLPPGDYFVLVASPSPTDVDFSVRFDPATPAPTNDTCATATVIPPAGGVYRSDLIDTTNDVSTPCGGLAPDTVYTFTLTEPRDVVLQLASARTDYLSLSLSQTCTRNPEVLRCDSGATVQMITHQLPAGTYYVFVEAFTPASYVMQASFNAPTPAVPGDTCTNALSLVPGMPVMVANPSLENDYALTCARSGPDSVFQFTLTEQRDVLIDVGGTPTFSSAAIMSRCGDRTTERACSIGTVPRVSALGLDPGTYYAVVKPNQSGSYRVTLQTFSPLAVTDVEGNDTCATARAIPPGRGYFRGSTATLHNDYNAPCAGGPTPGNDAVFSLHLGETRRVTLIADTNFASLLWVTKNDSCPGSAPTSTMMACTLGTHSVIDAALGPGDYYVLIDGRLASDTGTYGLQVQIEPVP